MSSEPLLESVRVGAEGICENTSHPAVDYRVSEPRDGSATCAFYEESAAPHGASLLVAGCGRGPYRTLFAATRTAPSGGEPAALAFRVVEDPEIKHRIRVVAEVEERNSIAGAPQKNGCLRWRAGNPCRQVVSRNRSLLIAVFAQPYAPGADGRKVKHYYVTESVGIAAGLLIAALHYSGLATLTHTPSPMAFLSAILERPPHERPFLLIVTGYPAQDARVPAISKKPLDELLHSVKSISSAAFVGTAIEGFLHRCVVLT